MGKAKIKYVATAVPAYVCKLCKSHTDGSEVEFQQKSGDLMVTVNVTAKLGVAPKPICKRCAQLVLFSLGLAICGEGPRG